MSKIDLNKQRDLVVHDKSKEEKIERTDPFAGEFSPSSLSYSQCLRKFLFEKIYKLKSSMPQYPLIFGSSIHKGVEYFYKNQRSSTMTFEDVKRGMIREFALDWASNKVKGDDKRNMDSGIILMGKYADVYRHEDEMFESVDIEGSQWVKMPNGTMLLVKMDRVGKIGDSVCIVDTKTTTGYINPQFWRQFINHMATSLYFHAMMDVIGKCDYVLIDAIKVPPLGPTSSADQFGRRSFMRTEEQMEEAIRTYCMKTNYLMDGIQLQGKARLDHFVCDQNRCDDYSGCPYIGICQHGITHPMVNSTFKFPDREREELAMIDFGLTAPSAPKAVLAPPKVEEPKAPRTLSYKYYAIKRRRYV